MYHRFISHSAHHCDSGSAVSRLGVRSNVETSGSISLSDVDDLSHSQVAGSFHGDREVPYPSTSYSYILHSYSCVVYSMWVKVCFLFWGANTSHPQAVVFGTGISVSV